MWTLAYGDHAGSLPDRQLTLARSRSFTYRLDETWGARLLGGLTWAHISNARIHDDDNNPGRDSLMLYLGIVFPF